MKISINSLCAKVFLISALSFPIVSFAADTNSMAVTQSDSQSLEQSIHLNKSTLDELLTLKGVGQKKAEAILAYRELIGGFKNIEELMNVKGIGNKIIADNKSRLKI